MNCSVTNETGRTNSKWVRASNEVTLDNHVSVREQVCVREQIWTHVVILERGL